MDEDRIRKSIEEKVKDKRIACMQALKIAEEECVLPGKWGGSSTRWDQGGKLPAWLFPLNRIFSKHLGREVRELFDSTDPVLEQEARTSFPPLLFLPQVLSHIFAVLRM